MIIDIHTHISNPEAWEAYDLHCRTNGVSIAIVSCLQAGLEQQGAPKYDHYPSPEAVSAANDTACRFAGERPHNVRWLAYINPQNENAVQEAERCLAGGAIGIKMWVALKDPKTGSMERTGPVLSLADQRKLPVLIHTYQRTLDNHPGEVTVPDFAQLARKHPGARMIAAHSGGNWRHMLGVLRDVPNAVIDVCGGYPEQGMVQRLAEDLGAERVLYGSDGLGRSLPSQIAKVLFADLSTEDRERIFWRNSARILGLTEDDVAAAHRHLESGRGLQERPLPAMDEDHFCFCGAWPFREGPHPTPQDLNAQLARHGIRKAYTGQAEAVYTYNMLDGNRAFAAAAKGCERIEPLAALAPYPPNWDVLVAEARQHFQGAILYPSLQNWRLNDPAYEDFFAACAKAGLPLWINLGVADRRFQHRGVAWRETAAEEVLDFIGRAPATNRYVFQGASRTLIGDSLEAFPEARHVRFELSRLTDNSFALGTLVDRFGWDALVHGSEYPWRDMRTVRYSAQKLCGQSV